MTYEEIEDVLKTHPGAELIGGPIVDNCLCKSFYGSVAQSVTLALALRSWGGVPIAPTDLGRLNLSLGSLVAKLRVPELALKWEGFEDLGEGIIQFGFIRIGQKIGTVRHRRTFCWSYTVGGPSFIPSAWQACREFTDENSLQRLITVRAYPGARAAAWVRKTDGHHAGDNRMNAADILRFSAAIGPQV